MVTLQELQARQVRATQEGLDGHHVVIVKGLGSLTSHLLYSLLFRLENVPGGATVILFEEDGIGVSVTDEDIQNGLYVPADRGKKHLDVLQDRYNGVFATEVLAGNQNLLHTLGRGEDLGTNL
ncbi:hypothetical protein, partial [Bacillus mycoides]|uniref:hypothetical protein n=1 Tax=Bacillus mycoides TaxID=1405 RepID=UPI003A7F77D6